MSEIEFHPLAVDEISAAYDYLFQHAGRGIAEDFRATVEKKLIYCSQNPLAYRIRRYQVVVPIWNGLRSTTSPTCFGPTDSS